MLSTFIFFSSNVRTASLYLAWAFSSLAWSLCSFLMAFWCYFSAPVPITRQPNGHDIWDAPQVVAPPTTSTRRPRWTPRPANLFDPRSNVIDTTTDSLSQRTEPLHRNATNFLDSRNQPTVSTPYPNHWPTSLFTTFISRMRDARALVPLRKLKEHFTRRANLVEIRALRSQPTSFRTDISRSSL